MKGKRADCRTTVEGTCSTDSMIPLIRMFEGRIKDQDGVDTFTAGTQGHPSCPLRGSDGRYVAVRAWECRLHVVIRIPARTTSEPASSVSRASQGGSFLTSRVERRERSSRAHDLRGVGSLM